MREALLPTGPPHLVKKSTNSSNAKKYIYIYIFFYQNSFETIIPNKNQQIPDTKNRGKQFRDSIQPFGLLTKYLTINCIVLVVRESRTSTCTLLPTIQSELVGKGKDYKVFQD